MNAGLPEGWTSTTVGALTSVVRGASPRPKGDPRYFGGVIPWIMISDITRQRGKFLYATRDHVTEAGAQLSRQLAAGDLILSNSGSVCIPKLLAVDGCIHDGFLAFPDLANFVSCDYAFWWFEYIRPAVLNEHRQGNTQVNLNTEIARNLSFALPPRDEQDRIVAKLEPTLSKVDGSRERLDKVSVILKRFRQAVLDAACSGRLTVKWRAKNSGVEPASTLLARIQKQLLGNRQAPEAVTDSERVEEIPATWVLCTLADLFVVQTGATPLRSNSAYYHNGTIPWIKTAQVQNGDIWKAEEYITDLAIKETNAKVFPEGTLLIAMYGEGKTRGQVGRLRIKAATNQASAALVNPNLTTETNEYIFYHALSQYARLRAEAVGGNQPNLSAGIIKAWLINFPPLEEQKEIVRRIKGLFSLADKIEVRYTKAAEQVDRLTQSVLAKAFRGELVTTEAELAKTEGRTYETAVELLARIKAAQATPNAAKPRNKRVAAER
jgi:type I restriction enzyme, S subunit